MEVDASKGLFLNDGCVVRKDVLILAAGFNADADGNCSRVIYTLDGQWRQFDAPDARFISVTAVENTGYLVSAHGLAVEVPLSPGVTMEQIDNAGTWSIEGPSKLGQTTRIRAIAGQPYCCGQRGQVYRLEGGKWVRADAGLQKRGGPDQEDIDGSGPSDIYTVGLDGAMHHFDGRKWKAIDLPTNVSLSNIRCVSPDLYYVCGNDGLIMKGARNRWEIIGDPVPDKNYWGLEVFEETVYLSHGKGIDRLTDEGVEPVDLKIKKKKLTFHRLHGRDGQLWSFGEDHMLKFDGKTWTEVPIPVR
jgi:hypothetical protein